MNYGHLILHYCGCRQVTMLVTFLVTSISIHNVGHVVNIMSMSADGLPRTLCQGMVMFCQGVSTSEVLQWSVPVTHLRARFLLGSAMEAAWAGRLWDLFCFSAAELQSVWVGLTMIDVPICAYGSMAIWQWEVNHVLGCKFIALAKTMFASYIGVLICIPIHPLHFQ